MAEIGDRRRCSFVPCKGEMELKRKHFAPGAVIPERVEPGEAFPDKTRRRAWQCSLEPKRHVEVEGWGIRPVKDCTVKGCGGVMVHSDKARTSAPDSIRRQPTRDYARAIYEAGYICLEDAEHFEPSATPGGD